MKVTVKLYAGFRHYLPIESASKGISLDIGEDATPCQVLDQLHIPENEIHLVLLNGVFVEPSLRNEPIFKNNDILAVWPAVAGG